MDADRLYQPSPWQTKFHSLPHKEALGGGAAGGGKSVALRWDPLQQIVLEHERAFNPDHPYHHGPGMSRGWALFLRREWPMVKQILSEMKIEFKRLDPGCEWRASDELFEFSSGFKYQVGHCAEVYSFDRYLGGAYTHVMYDELRQFERVQYENINSRLRSDDPLLMRMLRIRAMSNPYDPDGIKVADPHWVREHFVDPAPQGGKTLRREVVMSDGTKEVWDRIFLPARLSDNPNKEFARAYEVNLRNRPKHIQKAMLEGEWYVVVGAFFGDDWDSSVHVCRPFAVPTSWPHFRVLDWGFKTFGTCVWWARDPDGTWFVHRELNFKGRHPDQVAKDIIAAETEMGLAKNGRSLITGPADTQLWEQRGDRGLSKAAEMKKHGVGWIKANKAPNSIKRNSERLLLMLRSHHEDGKPGIVFFDRCRRCIQTIPTILPDKDNKDIPSQDFKDDHWLDVCRYGAEYAERLGGGRIPADQDERDEMDDKEANDDLEDRGQYGYGS